MSFPSWEIGEKRGEEEREVTRALAEGKSHCATYKRTRNLSCARGSNSLVQPERCIVDFRVRWEIAQLSATREICINGRILAICAGEVRLRCQFPTRGVIGLNPDLYVTERLLY